MSDADDEKLSPLADPTSVQFELVEDEGDERPGMTDEEIEDFLSDQVEPLGGGDEEES